MLVRAAPSLMAVVVGMAMLLASCGRSTSKETRNPITATATGTATITPSPLGTPVPTATLTAEQEIRAAYQRYWDVYSQAVLNLDEAIVDTVADGEELRSIRDEIRTLRARGLAARVNVTHNVLVVEITDSTATVYDEMVNNSFYVNAETKEPRVASGSGAVLRDTCVLQKTADGVWKVVSSGRQR